MASAFRSPGRPQSARFSKDAGTSSGADAAYVSAKAALENSSNNLKAAVKNLDDTLAMSGNYIDASNLELALTELAAQALSERRAAELLEQLRRVDRGMVFAEEDVDWATFKREVQFEPGPAAAEASCTRDELHS